MREYIFCTLASGAVLGNKGRKREYFIGTSYDWYMVPGFVSNLFSSHADSHLRTTNSTAVEFIAVAIILGVYPFPAGKNKMGTRRVSSSLMKMALINLQYLRHHICFRSASWRGTLRSRYLRCATYCHTLPIMETEGSCCQRLHTVCECICF